MNEQCTCGNPNKWADDPAFPVEYDANTYEFHIVHGAGRARWRMFFCPSCGGRLPKSRRESYFTTPSDEEKEAVWVLVEGIHDVASLRRVLGDPDATEDWSPSNEIPEERYGIRKWRRQFTYDKRWRTLILNAFEEEDRSVTFSISGRPRTACD